MGRSRGRMRPPDKSVVTARATLRRYLEAVRADFACSVEAVVLIGSLATGGYVPGPSDVDQITILRQDAASGTEDRLQACIDSAAAAYGRAVHLAPILYRRADLEPPWPVEWDLRAETRHLLVTVPEELLRIHDHGQVLHGAPSYVDALPAPTREEILACHRRLRHWDREVKRIHPRMDLALRVEIPPRLAVQVILSQGHPAPLLCHRLGMLRQERDRRASRGRGSGLPVPGGRGTGVSCPPLGVVRGIAAGGRETDQGVQAVPGVGVQPATERRARQRRVRPSR